MTTSESLQHDADQIEREIYTSMAARLRDAAKAFDKLEQQNRELRGLCGDAYAGILEHHSTEIMFPMVCPYCSGKEGDALLSRLALASRGPQSPTSEGEQ